MRALLAAVLWALSAPVAAQIFTPEQVKFLVDKAEGAEAKSQIIYHYFKKDRDPGLAVPSWIDSTLDAMLKRPVWQDPEEGVINEAQLWQAPVSVLYEFFELTRKTFLPSDGGQLAQPGALIRDYADNRIRFQMSLDRLYRAHLGSSLGGRGRAVMADFDLILKEMDSVVDALTAGNPDSYKDAVMAVGALTDNAFRVMNRMPRGYAPPEPPGSRKNAMAMAALFKLVGIALCFAAFWFVGMLNEARIAKAVEDYKIKAKEWAHDYERQFVAIKVNYLVGGPAALGILIGLLTFDPFGFLIFTGLGIYAGLVLPGWLLRNIRWRRGVKCEAQLMDAMILMSNGLKSGVDLVQCLEMVHRDLQPPISEEFGLCIKNYQLGTSLEHALEGVEDRVQSRLLSYMIKAVVIQRQVGGNLTKIFDRIVENIREETKLIEKTAAMTAQQRIQAIVVGLMPWVMFCIMFAFQPGPMKAFYFTPMGVGVLVFCTIWIAIGMKIVNTLGDVQV
jgi:tight adherence protein B